MAPVSSIGLNRSDSSRFAKSEEINPYDDNECSAPDDSAYDAQEYQRLTQAPFKNLGKPKPMSNGDKLALGTILVGGGFLLGGPVGAGALLLMGCYGFPGIGSPDEKEERQGPFEPDANVGANTDELQCSKNMQAYSTVNAPTPRDNQTAVWTGSEMIVWGGYHYYRTKTGGGSGPTNTGGRYNPISNSWTETTLANAPASRVGHTAVWTGSEMVVWGGAGAGLFNDGYRYDPTTNSWAKIASADAPLGRWLHTAVWTGSEMIVWGGEYVEEMNTGGIYNLSTDSWESIPRGCSTCIQVGGPLEPRKFHTAIWTGSEMIVWGGQRSSRNQIFGDGGRYNSLADTWTPIEMRNAPAARISHAAIWTGSEMIIWGGTNSGLLGEGLDNGGRYNVSMNSWYDITTVGAPEPRSELNAVWIRGKMIVLGGWNCWTFENYGGIYDLTNNQWVRMITRDNADVVCIGSAVWTGSEIMLWDGTNHCGRYIPSQ